MQCQKSLYAHKHKYSYHIKVGIKREEERLVAPSGKEEWPVIRTPLVCETCVPSHAAAHLRSTRRHTELSLQLLL